jgi:hypothetical protein
MGQGQAEFFFRTRAGGARGLYVPRMELQHFVPSSRLTRSYYWRWWFWKGIARAGMQDLHPVSELGRDIRTVPHLAAVPRYMWREAAGNLSAWVSAAVKNDGVTRAERETSLAYFAGYLKGRWKGALKRQRLATEPAVVRQPAAGDQPASPPGPTAPTHSA